MAIIVLALTALFIGSLPARADDDHLSAELGNIKAFRVEAYGIGGVCFLDERPLILMLRTALAGLEIETTVERQRPQINLTPSELTPDDTMPLLRLDMQMDSGRNQPVRTTDCRWTLSMRVVVFMVGGTVLGEPYSFASAPVVIWESNYAGYGPRGSDFTKECAALVAMQLDHLTQSIRLSRRYYGR